MKRRISSAATVAAVLFASLATTPSHASSDGYALTLKVVPQPLEVSSNGSAYTDVPALGNIVADVRVEISSSGSLNSWRTFLKIGAETVPVADWDRFDEYPTGESYGQGDEPQTINLIAQVIVPAVAYRQMALDHCNELADVLRQGGYTDAQIFGQHRMIELGVRASIQWDSTSGVQGFFSYGASDDELSWASLKKLRIRCKKHVQLQTADQINTLPPVVKKASLALIEQAGPMAGRCKLTLSGVIETSQPNVPVAFRYKDDAGNQSSIHNVTTDHAGIAMFDYDYDVPIDTQGRESGRIRIVGTSHGFESAEAAYDMDCIGPRFEALRPPQVEIDVVPFAKIRVGQQVCYSKAKLYAKVVAQNAAMSGQGVFIGDYFLSEPQAYDIGAGETLLLGGERDLDWTTDPLSTEAAAPSPQDQEKQQTIKIGFNLTNANDTVVASVPMKPFTIKCYFPQRNPVAVGAVGGNDDMAAAAPTNPSGGQAPALRSATPTAPGSTAQGAGQDQLARLVHLPDLTILQAQPGANPNHLRVVVTNSGSGAAAATRLKAVYRQEGRNLERSVPIKALRPGERASVVVDFGQPVKQARRIGLTIDEPDRVKESDEQNNRHRFGG